MGRLLTRHRIHKLAARRRALARERFLIVSGIVVLLVLGVAAVLVSARYIHLDHAITLMLRGESCQAHLAQLQEALQRVAGVNRVDTTQLPGHIVVQTDTAFVTPDDLIAVVREVKGDNWKCDAEPM